jgi:hypothetical protein
MALSYKFYISSVSFNESDARDPIIVVTSEIDLSGIEYGIYYVRIRSNNTNGESALSNLCILTIRPTWDSFNLNLLTDEIIYRNTNVSFNWNAQPNAEEYRIYREAINFTSFSNLTVYKTIQTTKFEETIKLDGTYYYAVLVYGHGFTSNLTRCIRINTKLLDKPTGLQLERKETSIKLSWNAVPEATSYDVYRYLNGNVSISSMRKIATVSTLEYVDTDIYEGVYYYRIVANSALTNSTASDSIALKITAPSILDEIINGPNSLYYLIGGAGGIVVIIGVVVYRKKNFYTI